MMKIGVFAGAAARSTFVQMSLSNNGPKYLFVVIYADTSAFLITFFTRDSLVFSASCSIGRSKPS